MFRPASIGFAVGTGSEFKNRNYSHSAEFVKVELLYPIMSKKSIGLELLIQPEFNRAKHQMLNIFFIKPETPNYEVLRALYSQNRTVNSYILNVGGLLRKQFSTAASCYILLSVGPMYTDTQTERLSKGFAFSDVLAVGFSYKIKSVIVDLRPSVQHQSNAGLGSSNAGYNIKNIELSCAFQL
ncbi:MAG: acyloxyacyl hydrolase [Flavobacterium sp.]